MVVVALPDGTLATQAYDGLGMRRKSQAGATTTNFVLDGQDVLLEADCSGVTQAAQTHRPGAGDGRQSTK